MSKQKNRFRGVWFGLIGLVVGLALGYLGAGLFGSPSLLGSSIKISGSDTDIDTVALLLQMERTEKIDQQIEEQMKKIRDRTDKGENTQLDMIRLQSLMNKRNQAFEVMSNLMSKESKARDAIIRNMD